MRTESKGRRVLTNGKFKFLLGANYWCRKHNVQMWNNWDLEAIKEDLDRVKELGLRALRIFLLSKDFSNSDGGVKEGALKKLEIFLDEASKREIAVFPSFIVGHMSGKNWFIPWDPYNEVYKSSIICRAKKFIGAVVERFKEHPAIGGWILSNEISLVKAPKSVDEFRVWASELIGEIEKRDKSHVISIGDSTRPISALPLKPENVQDLVGYLSPHIYYYDEDEVRHTYTYMAELEYLLSLDKPVILEEFGFPTNLFSEESHAKFIEVILYGALALGVSGAWIWCFSDFPREGDEPYLWEPHELSFGIIRANGTPKPAAKVVKEFANFLLKIEGKDYKLPEKNAAILVPSHFYKYYEFHTFPYNDIARSLVMAYILLKASGLNPTFMREEDIGSRRYKLIVIPSISRLLTVSWRKLLREVEEGAIVYYSHVRYFNWPHMSACHMWEELFGVSSALKAGSKALAIPKKFSVKIKDEAFAEARRLDFVNPRSDIGTVHFTPVDAKVVAVTEDTNTPLLYEVERGEGRAYLASFPLELILASQTKVSWENMYQVLYEFLGAKAGLRCLVKASDPRVQIEYWNTDEELLLFLLNHSYNKVRFELTGLANKPIEVIKDVSALATYDNKVIMEFDPKTVGILRTVLSADHILKEDFSMTCNGK